MTEEFISFKILLLGDTSVGKSSFIIRYCDDKFDDFLPKIGMDIQTKYLKVDGKKIELQLWEIRIIERVKSNLKNIFGGADGIILMYDISNINSFYSIKAVLNNIKETIDITKVALFIVGNKCDLPEDEKKVDQEIKNIFEKEHNIKIIEASAKCNINVNESFLILVKEMIKLGLGKKSSDDDDENDNKIFRIERNERNLRRRHINFC